MVIFHRATGRVVTATSFKIGATIALTPYVETSEPNKYQAWTFSPDGHITMREMPNLILGAGPVAQRQAASVYTINWDFKAALADKRTYTSSVHRFRQLPREKSINRVWSNFLNTQFDGAAGADSNIQKASCLHAPYNKPTNAALQEVWGPRCNVSNTNQQFAFFKYICHSCPVGTLGPLDA